MQDNITATALTVYTISLPGGGGGGGGPRNTEGELVGPSMYTDHYSQKQARKSRCEKPENRKR